MSAQGGLPPALRGVLLGIVEGLTEFLPVSSTGHLILLSSTLGHEDDASKTLDVVIQLGAVLAVIVYYRALLGRVIAGILKRDPEMLRLVAALAIAFFPAAILGFFFHKAIKEVGFAPVPVAIAAIVGGVAMIVIEMLAKRRPPPEDEGVKSVTPKRALLIGLAQCLSLWPGMSRSMTTILGGQIGGLRTATAAEFSFLLSIPILGAATLFDLAKTGGALLRAPGGPVALGVGLVTAFVVSLAVIAMFLRYLKRFGLTPFGIYRILLGIVVLWAAA
ncbi:MAG: undecaprenyl-diphosphate phosphatase [Polyangiaceae bacterium]|nr:undecaprenyl-diphosphate phosphatase [Polyangiaceae bacterium]